MPSPIRLQTSVLAAAEKRLLIGIAKRLPSWVSSDQLTSLALLAMMAAGVCFWLSSRAPLALWGVVLCLAINWFGDSLDGTVARVRDCQRPRYGYYVDHVIDAVGTLFLVGGMGMSGYMNGNVALALLVAYFLLTIEVYLASNVLGEFRMGFFGIGPTELRIIIAAGALTLLVNPTVTLAGREVLLFDLAGIVAAIGLVVTFLFSAARNTRRLYQEEPLRKARA